MAYILKSERTRKHAKTGEPFVQVDYIDQVLSFMILCTCRCEDAKRFLTAAEARCYVRKNGLDRRGYKPVRFVAEVAA